MSISRWAKLDDRSGPSRSIELKRVARMKLLMDGVLLLVRLLLSATFALAGLAKAADPAGTRQSILDFGAPAFLARPMALLLPLAELACAIALLPAASAVWGAAGTLALLLSFIVAIGI